MKAKDWDRISKDYYTEVISPIKNTVGENLLLKRIDHYSSKQKIVGDLGCGIGPLLGRLSEKYKTVYAVDYSKKMIKQAKMLNKDRNNIRYLIRDLSDLGTLKNKLNVVITVNSIIDKDIKKVDRILSQIYRSMKRGGVFIGVLPAMESYLYQAMLITEKHISKGATRKQAIKKIRNIMKRGDYDFLQGTITFDGDTQKTFYRFEILYRFEQAGFKDIKISKVHYDWKEWKEAGQAYFPNKTPPWDWFVECRK